MKAVLLIKQWPIWCIANIYNTGRLISIISEAGGMQRPAEIYSLGCVRNQAEEECIPVERSLGREQQESDPVASCDAKYSSSSWTSNVCEVFSGETWEKFGMLLSVLSLKTHHVSLYPPPL